MMVIWRMCINPYHRSCNIEIMMGEVGYDGPIVTECILICVVGRLAFITKLGRGLPPRGCPPMVGPQCWPPNGCMGPNGEPPVLGSQCLTPTMVGPECLPPVLAPQCLGPNVAPPNHIMKERCSTTHDGDMITHACLPHMNK